MNLYQECNSQKNYITYKTNTCGVDSTSRQHVLADHAIKNMVTFSMITAIICAPGSCSTIQESMISI